MTRKLLHGVWLTFLLCFCPQTAAFSSVPTDPSLQAGPSLQANEEQSPATAPAQHFGHYQRTLSDLAYPTAAAFDAQGWLWTADLDTHRLVAVDENNRLVMSLPWPKQSYVTGIDFDDRGHLWLSDRWNGRLLEVRPDGSLIQNLGAKEDWLNPSDVLVHGEEIWLLDTGHRRIVVLDRAGQTLRILGAELFEHPRAMCAAGPNRFAVVDSGSSSVILIDEQGAELGRFGAWGWFPGLFSDPTDILWQAGRFYVADRENQRVQVLDDAGEPLYRIGSHAILPREGEGKLHYPTRLALSADGQQIAIVEPMDQRIQIIGLAPGASPPPDPTRPESIQPSPHYGEHWSITGGYMALSEPETHKIGIYDLRLFPKDQPIKVTEIGGFGDELGQFKSPTGVAIVANPGAGKGLKLWVADAGNQRLVEVFLGLDPAQPLAQDRRAARIVRTLDWPGWNAALPVERRLVETPDIADLLWIKGDRLLALCRANRAVLILDQDWNLIGTLGAQEKLRLLSPQHFAWNPETSRLAISDEAHGVIWECGLGGEELRLIRGGTLRRPRGLDYDARGHLWVVDRWQSALFEFDTNGEFLSTRFTPGLGRGELYGPTDFAIVRQGDETRHWVLDHGNHRGMVFDPQGAWISAFGSRLYTKPARLPHTQDKSPAKTPAPGESGD